MDPLAFGLNLVAFAAGAATTLLAVVVVAVGTQQAGARLPAGRELARYGGGVLVTLAGLYVAYLQLGWLIGYPFGVPALTLPV